MKPLFLLAVVMTLLWSVAPVDGGIQEVHIEPNHPTNTDLITIVASGHWGGCGIGIEASDFRVEGASLELDIFSWVGYYGGICPWSHSEVIGTLPAGSYNLTVYAYIHNPGQPYSLGDTYSISFTVVPDNSNSIVKDGIEYYVQTDKAVYVLGEDVQMLYRVTNLRDEEVTFTFPHTPVWNFWVEKDGNDIFRGVNGWWAMGSSFALEHGESKSFPVYDPVFVWNMRDMHGSPVTPAEYTVIGGLHAGVEGYEHTEVGIAIKIMAEPVDADVEIAPDRVNLASRGKWISCHIRLPEGYDVADVNSYSILLEDEIEPEWIWFNEKQNVVMAKFRRSDVEDIVEPGLVELTLTGELLDGTPFEGRDTIRVIDKGKTKQLTRKHRP